MEFNKEQIKDITARELECLEFLREKQMCPSVKMVAVNVGGDCFCMKPIPFLNDLKYAEPVKPQDLPVAE
jgi:hypothetical protein